MNEKQLLRSTRIWLILFIIGLALSGITAFPIETKLAWLSGHSSAFPRPVGIWISTVYEAIKVTNQNYPYLSYGTDWLAFGHLVIATFFLGPLKDPVKHMGITIWHDGLCYGFPAGIYCRPCKADPVLLAAYRLFLWCFGAYPAAYML